jgi:c-di-GMP-binding flagellar brake protein YcgR
MPVKANCDTCHCDTCHLPRNFLSVIYTCQLRSLKMQFERRRSVRVPCELSSSIRNIGTISSRNISTVQSRTSCFATDISNGGVKLVVPKFIPLNTRLMLSLNIPQYGPVEIQVEPVWIREEPAISSFSLGTRFMDISEEGKIAIKSFQAQRGSPPG